MATPREEITLPVGATAEPGTCGSCKYFRREGQLGDHYRHRGGCAFRMPAVVTDRYVLREYEDGDEYIRGFIEDTHGCDLYRNDGKVYIVQRRIPND